MEYNMKKHQANPAYTMVSLFIILFYISFINSYRLLAITTFIIMLSCVIFYNNKSFIKMTKPVLPFVILMLLPLGLSYMMRGSIRDFDFTIMIICKVLLSSILLGTIVSEHSPLYLVEGILNLGLPQVFNRILVLTFRYFHMINEDVQKGRQALISRGINERKGLSAVSIFGEWIGGFFLKSSTHGEMVFHAMKSRGFEGESNDKEFENNNLIIKSCMLITFLTVVLIIDGKV